MMDAVATSMDLKRAADALERIANMLETIGTGWASVDPANDWRGNPWPRCAPLTSNPIASDSSKGEA
jgi:hypothetical protein